jgi:hypothetical protein
MSIDDIRSKFLVEPPALYENVELAKNNFGSPFSNHPSHRNKPHPYLLLGFDTEYQSPPPIVELGSDGEATRVTVVDDEERKEAVAGFKDAKDEGWLRNELLSYQFHCYILDPDVEDTEPNSGKSWNGVVLPFDDTEDGRLSVAEFVAHALSMGVKKYSDIEIPTDIYFIAHFTRADVPGFQDFRQKESDIRLAATNVRNTFVSIYKDIKINVPLNAGGEVELSLKLRDTITLAPALRKSLLEVGKMLNFEKIKLADTDDEEKSIKENMKEFKSQNWGLFKEYGIRDAEVCVKYAKELIEINHQETQRYIMPATLTSMAVSKLKLMWKDKGWEAIDIVGKEKKEDKVFNSSQKRTEKFTKTVYKDKVYWHVDFATESYHGGRNEQFWFGACWEDDWVDWDLQSAYASTMAMIGKPDWDSIRQIKSDKELLNFKVDDLAFASVTFEFPPDARFPCLPVRTMHGLVFPLKGTSICGIPEILLAKKLKAKMFLREGYYIETNKDVPIFKDFIVYCIEQRNHYKKTMGKGNLYEQFWKEMGNSTYGKTAQGLRERRVYDLKELATKRLKESDITNPFFASFITSYVRATLAEILNNLPKSVCVFSVTTDGFLTNATEKQMEEAQVGELCDRFRLARQAIAGDDEILEIKHKVRQPIGWRTRGQATLKPAKDWDRKDDGYEKDSNYVLAKGGITLNRAFEKAEQNSEIIKWFLERKPNHAIRFETLLGIKDAWEFENDIVPQPMQRVLSMEFDWKRKPHYIDDGKFEFEGKTHEHVFWETVPWYSVEDFMQVRETFEQYNHGNDASRHCIKTKNEYDEFRDYLENQISLPEKDRAWMRKSGGAQQRLRQYVLAAWRKRLAGTEIINWKGSFVWVQRKKMRHQDFVDWFNAQGVACTIKDVENSKRKDYIPHRVPNTDETNRILQQLKDDIFPTLDIDNILSEDRGVNMKSVDKENRLFEM